ncbi:AraC family transcriptional regulator [Salinarimonas ramus]|uniref:Transcriptional regulator n=1 Tax=Salinarimonas ramus TaxID=690164 RepID=A0A917V4Z0_9HYPH|nr:AraC family transcriptional regulator [Salinarimonas ramus]GGK38409.1 transcriptional regulator [Salinarimonas ramus]
MARLRLAAHAEVDTRDVDEAAREVGRIFCAHRLSARSRPRLFHARHHSAPISVGAARAGSINLVAYGGDVLIDPGCLDRFFLVQVPLSGGADIACGRRETPTAPGRAASILSPTEPVTMRWSGSCAQLILMLDRAHVERAAARFLDRDDGAVVFAPSLDLERGVGPAVVAQMERMATLAEIGAGEPGVLPRLGEVMDAAIATLLFGHASNVSGADTDADDVVPAPPRAVARALAHIDAHLTDGIDNAALCAEAGVGLRALQGAFRRALGRTISEIVRERRLEALRARLRDPADRRPVGEIMLEVGLWHFGRAAQAYRARFGETPRETRDRAR